MAGEAVEAAVQAAAETLAVFGRDLAVARRRLPVAPREADGAPGPAPAAAGLSRRDLFTFLARGARRTASEGLAPERRGVADLHGQAPPPASHGRLLDDLRALGAGVARSGARPAGRPAPGDAQRVAELHRLRPVHALLPARRARARRRRALVRHLAVHRLRPVR